MKKLLLTLLVSSTVSVLWAQTAVTAPANKPVVSVDVLQVKETQFDFGKIPQGKPVTHVFEVVNTGKEVLKIENVQASCGCTTPEWSKDPINPGDKQKITVGYNAASEGPFEKSISIFYGGQVKQIVIKGTVWKTPDNSAPQNRSIAILKSIN